MRLGSSMFVTSPGLLYANGRFAFRVNPDDLYCVPSHHVLRRHRACCVFMPKYDLSFHALVHLLDDEYLLAEPLLCPETSQLGRDPARLRKAIESRVRKTIEQLAPGNVHRRLIPEPPRIGSIEIADRKVPLSGWYLDPTGDGRVKRVDAGKVLIVYPDDPKPNRICLHTLAGKQNEMLGEAPPGTNALIVPHCKPSNDISWRDYSR